MWISSALASHAILSKCEEIAFPLGHFLQIGSSFAGLVARGSCGTRPEALQNLKEPVSRIILMELLPSCSLALGPRLGC